ncbi:MAG: dihydrodipicolinate synthase family protein [Candidatus Hydrogenedentes bacterium]|nr:dihydrodipicolinate synthase family protein [Candidatus Hydrogenedentota bacterium]
MKKLLNLPGIITVLNTPFTIDNEIDYTSLRRNVRNAIDAGVAGFLVPAMASEVGKLSEAERDGLLAAVLDEVQGRAPVIGGASAGTQAERVRYARRCVELGCSGVLVSLSYTDEAQYERELRGVADTGPPFLMVQDWDFSGYGAPVPLIARLFEEVEAFRCLKVEVVPAGRKYSEVLAATSGRLHVSGGWAVTQMIEALDRGVHAFMPTGMHAIYTRIFALYQRGDREGAGTLFRELLPVLAFSNQHLDISIHFFKRLLHAEGVYTTPNVREPILPFDAYHERIAEEMIERVKRITTASAS